MDIDNSATGSKLGIRRITIDEEARFLSLVPDDVRQFVLYEAAINWCAKAVYQLYQLRMEQDGPETVNHLRRAEASDLRDLIRRQDAKALDLAGRQSESTTGAIDGTTKGHGVTSGFASSRGVLSAVSTI